MQRKTKLHEHQKAASHFNEQLDYDLSYFTNGDIQYKSWILYNSFNIDYHDFVV